MISILRAEKEWQRAGAYSVRIQGMNRQHHISLREEFDDHDGDGTRYIVILDDEYPVATARFYELNPECVMLRRVVVLPEYRNQGLGNRLLKEAEEWMRELGYTQIDVDSRTVATGFYEKNGFQLVGDKVEKSGCFECIRMRKNI